MVAFNRIGLTGLEIPCSELNNGGDEDELKHSWDALKECLADIVRVGLWQDLSLIIILMEKGVSTSYKMSIKGLVLPSDSDSNLNNHPL